LKTPKEVFCLTKMSIWFCCVQMQVDVSTGLLILGVLCHSLPLMLRYAVSSGEHAVSSWDSELELSRACSIVMLLAYVAYLFFQLKTHRQLFEPQEVCL
jgi:Ca2+:H+ antiporter